MLRGGAESYRTKRTRTQGESNRRSSGEEALNLLGGTNGVIDVIPNQSRLL